MLDRILNPTPTFYKWDRFWVGFLPALVCPFIGFMLIYLVTMLSSNVGGSGHFTFQMYLTSLRDSNTFLRVSTLSCFGNAAVFFLFINRNYYNASRAVVITTMLFVMAILAKELIQL